MKGRSSSRSINKLLRQSIPKQASNNCRPFYGFVRSKLNPADDPTRSAEVRAPSRAEAVWLEEAKVGKFANLDLDEMLRETGVHPSQINELPDEDEQA